MIQDITVTVAASERTDEAYVTQYAARELNCRTQDITALVFKKKSLDARHGKAKYHLRYTVYTAPDEPSSAGADTIAPLPEYRQALPGRSVLIIGAGPAGLFAALRLLENGVKPIIVERGSRTGERKRDIAAISTKHEVNADSNYCFGEGGAGTFSDGKLYTRSVKRGDPAKIYRIFNHFGAPADILTDAHPHIGTDKLPHIIGNMTAKIEELGGTFYFDTKCTGFITQSAADETPPRVTGVTVRSTKDGETQVHGSLQPSAEAQPVHAAQPSTEADRTLNADAVLLATGHSACDVYELLARTAPEALEAKTFAAGVRVEHPRKLVDHIQYHGRERTESLPAAEYRLTAQIAGPGKGNPVRGVYSFCMCPGGLVVPSASDNEGLVVNGMSPSSRAARWSNAAIVVEIRPEDIPPEYGNEAEQPQRADALSGLRFRTQLERLAKQHGDGQAAPAQRLTDFLAGRASQSLPETSYTPGIVPSRLDLWLPEHIGARLKEGFKEFGRKMPGFITDEAVLIAPETRTSTPVRILRDRETMECTVLCGLYPAGEGSGYAGGIVSSAMDGEKAAEAIIRRFAGV